MSLAVAAAAAGFSGLENLSGIPSTVGGAVRINAGAYGTEIFDLLETVELVTPGGGEIVLHPADLRHTYRFTELMERRDVVAAATLLLWRRPPREIEARLAEVRARRRHALPKEPNAGSIFRNPPGLFAGKLLEECGAKGLRCGGAEVSETHANVIVNAGGATAREFLRLMDEMQAAVREKFGVELVPEIEIPSAQGRPDAMRRGEGP
jgi:UDP-N-acetylmuramate dehydrogenase